MEQNETITMMIGKHYKHKQFHSYIKIESFDGKYFWGIGFYRNEYNMISIGERNVFHPIEYEIVSKEDFEREFNEIHNEILQRIKG